MENEMKLLTGAKAPEFSLVAHNGETIRLSQLQGKWVVLYFYPKDDTPGCTKEACNFRDQLPNFKKKKAVILGVSKDGQDSHQKFVDKFSLPFLLLSDTNGQASKAYGVVNRSTFLIDPQGNISRAWYGVKVDGHDAEVLAAIG